MPEFVMDALNKGGGTYTSVPLKALDLLSAWQEVLGKYERMIESQPDAFGAGLLGYGFEIREVTP